MEKKNIMQHTMAQTIMANADGDVTGYKLLAMMQTLTIATKSADVFEWFNGEESDELLALLQMSDAEELKKALPDELMFKYRTVNKTQLKGLMRFGSDEVEVDFKTLPDDHMIPEVIEAQREFVIYRMMSKVRRKLVMSMNRELTGIELKEMRPETIQKLSQLVDVLVDGMTAEELEKSDWGQLKKRVDEEIAEIKNK